MILSVRVQTRSSRPGVEKKEGTDQLVCRVSSPPLDERANKEVIARIAAHYGCGVSRVRIIKGERGRNKVIEVLL